MARKWMVTIIVMVVMVAAAAMAGAQPPVADDNRAAIAVAAEGATPETLVSRTGARAPYFLLFDGQGQFVEALVNPHQEPRRAGQRVVTWLSSRGVGAIIAGDFGDKMAGAMNAAGMARQTAAGSVAEAVKGFIAAPPKSE